MFHYFIIDQFASNQIFINTNCWKMTKTAMSLSLKQISTLLLAARIHRVYYGGFEWSFPGTYVNFQMLKIVRNIHMGLGFIPWEAVPTTLASTWDGCCDTGLVTWIHSPDCQPPTRRASSPCPDPKSRSPDTRFLNRRVGVTKQNWVYQDLNPRRNNQLLFHESISNFTMGSIEKSNLS